MRWPSEPVGSTGRVSGRVDRSAGENRSVGVRPYRADRPTGSSDPTGSECKERESNAEA